jgi:hypothetical protein
MLCTRTFIGVIDPRFAFSGTQQAVGFRDGPFPMAPCRVNGGAPRTVARHVAADEAHALGSPLDLLMVLAEPGPHGMAAVPRGVVPAQQPRGEALGRELGGAPRQASRRDGAHGTPRDTAQP